MKKILILSLAAIALITALSPAADAHHGPARAQAAAALSSTAASKPLIVYFSRTGSTKTVADMIRQSVGGDIFEIVPQNAYPAEYRATTEQARRELNNGFRPALKTAKIPNLASYDVVFLGYPIWWGGIPPVITSFLEANDLAGKTIIPFCTHGGSGMGGTRDIQRLAPRATLLDGLAIYGSGAGNSRSDVNSWLRGLGLLSGEATA